MENLNEQFINELNEVNEKEWEKFYNALKDKEIKLSTVRFVIEPDKEMLDKYGLNENITFISNVRFTGEGKMEYYYKNLELDPECYYIRPDNYTEVTLLEILQECIKQDTNTPDIKQLEIK